MTTESIVTFDFSFSEPLCLCGEDWIPGQAWNDRLEIIQKSKVKGDEKERLPRGLVSPPAQ
jgi:hypothetical protein